MTHAPALALASHAPHDTTDDAPDAADDFTHADTLRAAEPEGSQGNAPVDKDEPEAMDSAPPGTPKRSGTYERPPAPKAENPDRPTLASPE